jgi:hypothetical protein
MPGQAAKLGSLSSDASAVLDLTKNGMKVVNGDLTAVNALLASGYHSNVQFTGDKAP